MPKVTRKIEMTYHSGCEEMISQNMSQEFLSINNNNNNNNNNMNKKGEEGHTLFKTRTLDALKFPYRSRSLPLKGSDSPRQRIDVACQRCRRRKIRCSGDQGRPDGKCTHCIKANYPCEFVSRLHPSIQISPMLISTSPQSPSTVETTQAYLNSIIPFQNVVSPTGIPNMNLHDTTLWSGDLSPVTLTHNHTSHAPTIFAPDSYRGPETLTRSSYSSPFSCTSTFTGLHSYLTNDPSLDLWTSEGLYTPSHESSSVLKTGTDIDTSDQYLAMPPNRASSELPLSFDLQTSQFWSPNTFSQFTWTSECNKDIPLDSVPMLSSSYDASSDSAWDSQSPITDLFPNNTIDTPVLDSMFSFIKDLSPTPVLQDDNSAVI